ncbi:DNA-binding transcriptional activator of the SARP family [Lentzea xinjiangensis]|uniref:DNA-binding transcriptional activator of the SARP family n=1 Tax=Lentzea xinjiangensis TaxID=402600 RepID=A0A1H9RFU5_9PSEU|nr:BTAD domain-containing putative transcriptional regulator [Lentzea xinjiangensis]SER71588.1 DNA-binding transcriptional activator of the SARP family [Lentzea xinjiangensis]
MGVDVGLLGEVTAQVDGRTVDLGPAKRRCVLAALAADAGRVVPADRLVEQVWGPDRPRRARAALHSHISRLRRTLLGAAGVGIVLRSGGYLLTVDHADHPVDLHRFRDLRTRARDADDRQAVELLTEAVALWRGEPLTGLTGQWAEAERDRLRQELLATEHDLIDARLRVGQGEELVVELAARAARYPLDERVAGQYLLALHRAGRSADALEYYRQLRDRLVEELGADPGAPLQELHQRILAADSALSTRPGGGVTAPVVVPRQLPAAPSHFTGRETDLAALTAALEQAGRDRTVVISAIGGAGGIGKTWLALTWAHQHAERFPDGRLFVDLHGFSPTQEPMPPEVAIRGFLDALGVDPGRIPTDLHAQAALYRSLVADRRMVVVLDNAVTAEQVVPLLPGSPACTVLITSRSRLASLIDRHGARHLRLDVLTREEARALLAARIGAGNVAAEPEAVDELVESCGGYPLALSITARHAATRPGLPLAEVAAELRELGLEMLDHDTDPAASLPAVLSWSLRRLTDEHRTVFALLGIAPGPDTTLPAVAALTGLPPARARKALSALEDASLVERRPGGRYGMHDLVRAYATTIARQLPHEVRDTALVRVMDFHLHTVHAADHLLNPHRTHPQPGPPAPGVHPHPLPDAAAATAWLEAEHATLLATQRTAAALGRHHVVWHLARALDTFHYRRGHLRDTLAMWRAALDAATHLPNPATRSRTHRHFGHTCARLGLHAEATEHLDQALSLAMRHHDPTEQAHTHRALAYAWEERGDDRRALDHARHALDLYRALGQPVREADALNAVGWCAARLGDFDNARASCVAALTLYRRHHHPAGEATTLDSLGFIAHRTGDHQQAIDHYHQALTLFRTLGDAYQAADSLDNVGHPHTALGQHEQARHVWREALELYREQGRHDDAERVQRQLDDLGPAQESSRPSDAGDNTQNA